jgi:parallel beta-helix repeat protein
MSKNKYLLILVLLGLISLAGATILHVPSALYPTIQSAIDAAAISGDIIQVAAGQYIENVNVNKSVTLQGASAATDTVTAANASAHVFNITASNVAISGFTATGAIGTGTGSYAGMNFTSGVTNCNIHDNILTVNEYGILIVDPENTTVAGNNIFTNNIATNNNISGIEMQHSYGNTFMTNTSNSNTKYGFRLDGVSHNTFTGNIANLNTQYGFSLVKGSSTNGCEYNMFTGNIANSNTQYGLREDNGDHNTFTGNTFDSNIIEGIRLKEIITNLTLENNNITNNGIGINIATAVTDVSTWTVLHNNIAGNATYGIWNSSTVSRNMLIAENNWWGDATGPYNATLNPTGTGNDVTDNVDFDPWLLTPHTGWYVSVPMPTLIPPKYVKDGGAIVAATSPTDEANAIYAFKGWRSKEFKMFNGTFWIDKAEIPFATKPGTEPPIDIKKYPGKGASLCWDGEYTIYAVKGNNTFEFWAYDIAANTWARKKTIATPKGLKGGTSICWYDGKVYLLAGGQKNDELNNFYAYTPGGDSGTWTAPGDLAGAPRQFPDTTIRNKAWKDGSCIVPMGSGENGVIYALKGGDKYNFLCAYDVGNTITPHSWATKETIPRVHPMLGKKTKTGDGGAMTTDGSFLYAIKGGGKQDFWMFTPGTPGVWAPLETIPRMGSGYGFRRSVPKTGAGLAYLDGYVYLLKGNKLDEFWRYITGLMTIARVNPSTITTTTSETTTKLNLNLTVNSFTRTINYTIQTAGKVSLKLYNATGRLVETVYDGYINAGTYTTTLSNVNSGVYFLRYEDKTNRTEIKLIVQ